MMNAIYLSINSFLFATTVTIPTMILVDVAHIYLLPIPTNRGGGTKKKVGGLTAIE